MLTKNSIISDLKKLGIQKGDTLFLRISYKALGKSLEGGPQTFINALLDVVGELGTIVVIALPKRYSRIFRFWNREKKRFISSNPECITTGVIPFYISKHKDVVWSNNQFIPFCAIGYHAKTLMESYTDNSIAYEPMVKIAELNGKCLRVGGRTLIGTTHISLTKSFEKNDCFQRRIPYGFYYKINDKWTWHDNLPSLFCPKGFEKFYHKYLERDVVIASGRLGEGEAVVTDMNKSLYLENKLLSDNPRLLVCDDPHCLWCRYTYSFSDKFFGEYIRDEMLFFINNRNKKHLINIYNSIKIKFIGKLCQ